MKTNFMGKCYAGMDGMFKGMKHTNLNWKQDGKAAEAEKAIHTMTREIGNLTVVMLDGDRSVGPDIKERYAAILESRKLMPRPRPEKSIPKPSARTAERRAAPGCTIAAGAVKLLLMKHSSRKLIKRIQSEGGSTCCLPFFVDQLKRISAGNDPTLIPF